MYQNFNNIFYCPKCGKKADTATPMFIRYSVKRLTLVIFLCIDCRTIHLNKPTNRKIISQWRKSGMWVQIPFNKLCREFIGKLESQVAEYWVRYLGYEEVRFLKHPPKF